MEPTYPSLLYLLSAADPGPCQEQFKTDVKACTKNATPGLELAWCLSDAREAKKACRDAPSQCELTCQENHATAIEQCEINFNPDLCNGDTVCEDDILEVQTDCKETADFELSQCLNNCAD